MGGGNASGRPSARYLHPSPGASRGFVPCGSPRSLETLSAYVRGERSAVAALTSRLSVSAQRRGTLPRTKARDRERSARRDPLADRSHDVADDLRLLRLLRLLGLLLAVADDL